MHFEIRVFNISNIKSDKITMERYREYFRKINVFAQDVLQQKYGDEKKIYERFKQNRVTARVWANIMQAYFGETRSDAERVYQEYKQWVLSRSWFGVDMESAPTNTINIYTKIDFLHSLTW